MNNQFLNIFFVIVILCSAISQTNGQCENNSAYPGIGIQAPTIPGDTLVVTEFQIAGDYYGMVGFEIGETYNFGTSNSIDFFTLRTADNQQVLASGNNPLVYTINEFTEINVHINLQNPACGTEAIARNSYVFISEEPVSQNKIGINTEVPMATLDVNGKVKIGDDDHTAVAGAIRWNETKKDFEGYNGSDWLSFTGTRGSWGPVLIEAVQESDKITATDTSFYKNFGATVDVYGDFAIIGAFRDSVNGLYDVGAAYLFKKTNKMWTEVEKLTADVPTENANFGQAVAIGENFLAIGSAKETVAGDSGAGTVYIYRLIGGDWLFQEKLQAFSPAINENYGASIALYEDKLVVGAPSAKRNNIATGEAYVHKFTGAAWANEDLLFASDGVSDSQFGASVDFFDKTIIVGDPTYPGVNEVDVGAAYIFTFANLSWGSEVKLVDLSGSSEDFFGSSVTIGHDYAAVSSADRNNNFNFLRGSVFVFAKETNWGLDQMIRMNGESTELSRFGHDIDIEGNVLLIGNNKKERESAFTRGAGYVYKRGDHNWTKEATLLASDGMAFDHLGSSVSINNSTIMIGAQHDELIQGLITGSVYIFNYCE